MKNAKKNLYALTSLQADAALDACNRVTADSPRTLGISNARFDACDEAAYALRNPEIKADKVVLILTPLEFSQLHGCLLNGYGDGDYADAYCFKPSEKAALGRAIEKVHSLQGGVIKNKNRR